MSMLNRNLTCSTVTPDLQDYTQNTDSVLSLLFMILLNVFMVKFGNDPFHPWTVYLCMYVYSCF